MNKTIPIPMTAEAYLFSISRATAAQDLHQILADIKADDSLFSEEKESLGRSVHLRFGQLNLQAAGTPKPRWN